MHLSGWEKTGWEVHEQFFPDKFAPGFPKIENHVNEISSGTRDNAFPQQSFPWTPSGRWVFSPLSFRSPVLPFAEQGDGRNKAGCKCYWVEIAPCAFLFSYLHSNVGAQVHQCIIICTFSVLDAVLQKSAPTHSSAHLQARLCFPLRVVRNTTNFRY